MRGITGRRLGQGGRDGRLSYVNWTGDGEGRRVAKDFILDFISGACRRSMDHWRGLDLLGFNLSHPLRYNERMFYSTFAAAISDVTPIHLSEMAISRKSRGVDSKGGRADFWAYHRKHNFFIELKQTTIGVQTEWSEKKLEEKFTLVERQTRQLQQEAKERSRSGSGPCVLVGLQVILPYRTRSGDKNANQKHFVNEVGEQHGVALVESARSLEKSVDFCAVWSPPQEARHFEFDSDSSLRTAWNPYVGFVAKILFP